MPWDKSQYPANWADLRRALLFRAGNCCETSPAYPTCMAVNGLPHPETGSIVALTLAHLCRCLPKCGEPSHLRTLCQRCHLTLDVELHQRHAAETFRRQSEAAGQLRLFGETTAPWAREP